MAHPTRLDRRSFALSLCLTLAACATPVGESSASKGAAGLGDAYYPNAGNGGYDVLHYNVNLSVDVESGEVEGLTIVSARATQVLSAFNLDLFDMHVEDVTIDGTPVNYLHADGELVITCEDPLPEGELFEVTVDYHGVPQLVPDPAVAALGLEGNGWLAMGKNVYVMSECIGTAGWMPCNNHPQDKATFEFHVDVPEPYRVAANGTPGGVDEADARRTFHFEMNHPMATYLATVNIADFALRTDEGPHGLPLYHYYPKDATEKELLPFARTKELMEHFIECFGPYPFDSYGGVLAEEDWGGALETQSLPVYSRNNHEDVVAHELAHMWFGDSVSPKEWKDIWLNEGFAVYAGWLWREHLTGSEGLLVRAETTYLTSLNFETGSPYDPGVEQLFGDAVYARGALVLDALRRDLGDPTFFKLLKTWTSRYAGQSASTRDFIDLAQEVAGKDLGELFDAWLFSELVPDVPEYLGESEDFEDAE